MNISKEKQTNNTKSENGLGKLNVSNIMYELYQEISKKHNVPIDRIMLAITDNSKYFQAYSTNQNEDELLYLCDVRIPDSI